MRFDEPTPVQLGDLSFYSSLGLRCGLEVHRQLATKTKLFCSCPVRPYSPDYDAEILRHMRPTLSELGEYDPTALMEFKTRKHILYRLNRETVCTYEMDDSPPFRLNPDALERALIIAVMLNLDLVDELHISRKQYLDGSIPTGFQRTLILGVNGKIRVFGRQIGIRQLGLEEEACREVSDVGHVRTFMTDRLSIPLVEIVTEPEARTPLEAAEFARTIRRICHLSGVVRTGLGTVRQDVNVSIEGGERVEIKGVPRIRQIPLLVHYEALRQKALLELREEAKRRGLEEKDFLEGVVDVTAEVKRLGSEGLSHWKAEGMRAKAVLLRGCAGLLNFRLGPTRTFASEVSDRVRVIACLDKAPNCLHSDLPYGNEALMEAVRKKVGAGEMDAFVVVGGPQEDVRTAVEEIRIRFREIFQGVVRETRKALPNGETAFERLLPGPNRMYPDTDLPPIVLHDSDFERARQRAPKSVEEVFESYSKLGLSWLQIENLILLGTFRVFDEALPKVRLRPTVLAYLLTDYYVALRREGIRVEAIDAGLLSELFGKEGAENLPQKEAKEALRRRLICGVGSEG